MLQMVKPVKAAGHSVERRRAAGSALPAALRGEAGENGSGRQIENRWSQVPGITSCRRVEGSGRA